MSAHLWRLTTALECLDLPAIRRQLRALDVLAEESGSAAGAVLRRRAPRRCTRCSPAISRPRRGPRDAAVARRARRPARPTPCAIDRLLTAGIARQAGDRAALRRRGGARTRSSARAEGVAVDRRRGRRCSGWRPARADRAARAAAPAGRRATSARVARDVDWLLTMTLADRGRGRHRRRGAARRRRVGLLAPYAGRGVVNAGAAAFAGVVDDYLFRALLALGRDRGRRAVPGCRPRRPTAGWARPGGCAGVTGRAVPAGRGRRGRCTCTPPTAGIWSVGRHGATRGRAAT